MRPLNHMEIDLSSYFSATTLAELGGVSAVAQLVFRSALTPEHAEGRWTARRAFLQTAPAVGIRSCVILANVSRAGFGLLYVVDVKSRS
jgi:hypothetical protein